MIPFLLWFPVLATLVLTLAPAQIHAENIPLAKQVSSSEFRLAQSVVELRVISSDGQSECIGTGVYVQLDNGKLYLLTAAHVVNNAGPLSGARISFRPVSDESDSNWQSLSDYASGVVFDYRDRCGYSLERPIPGMIPAVIAAEQPKMRQPVIAFGCADEHAHVLRGLFLGTSLDGEYDALHLGSDHGDSGGPVFNQQGQLVAVISASASDQMSGFFSVRPVLMPDGRVRLQSVWIGGNALHADTIAAEIPQP